MEKMSNSKVLLLKKAAGSVMWKPRFFVLLEDRLFYSKNAKVPTNAEINHQMDLRTVTAITVRRDSSPMEIVVTSRVTVHAPEVRWTMRVSDGLASLELWARRLYHNCEQLVDPEIQYLCSAEFFIKTSILKALDEREKVRLALKWGSRNQVEEEQEDRG